MSDDHISEADFDRAMARVGGRSDPAYVVLFRDAGFEEADAERGAKLMESGAFFGFEDVATTMLTGLSDPSGRRRFPNVSAARIAEAAKRAPAPDIDVAEASAPPERSKPPVVVEEVSEIDFDKIFPVFGGGEPS